MKNELGKWLVGFADWSVKLIIVAAAGVVWKINIGQVEVLNKLNEQQERMNRQQSEIDDLKTKYAIIEGKMVGWDTVTRIERSLGMMAAMGKGNQAMAVVANVLKAEREARQQK